MKIRIRSRGVVLGRSQRARLEGDLALALAKFGDRIDRVAMEISEGEVAGVKLCEIEVQFKARILRVASSDTDLAVAMEYAIQRVVRSVSRAIEIEALLRR